jgi:hypothetical protein
MEPTAEWLEWDRRDKATARRIHVLLISDGFARFHGDEATATRRLQAAAAQHGIDISDGLCTHDEYETLTRTAANLRKAGK